MADKSLVNQQMLQKKIQYLYEDFHVRFASFTVTSLVIAYISSKIIDIRYIVYWLSIGAIVFTIRSFSHYLYQKHKNDANFSRFWGKVFFYNAAITGIYFGLSSLIILLSQSEAYSITVGAVVFAYTISVMNSSVSYMPAFYVFMIFALLPFSVVAFFYGTPYLAISIGTIDILFIFIFLMISRGNGKVYNELLKLRFELQHKKELAEEANLEKSRFLAAASHDLRQPLNTLSLSAGLLDNLKLDASCQAIIDVMKKSVTAMDGMFGSLLDISKLDAGIIIPLSQHYRIDYIIKLVVNENLPIANDKEINIHYDECKLTIYSDPILLESIIRNLVSNAIRYTSKGTVSILTEVVNDVIKLKITDTGIGISNSEKSKIFNEYYQISNPERDRTKGIGLGLSIVKRLVNLLKLDMDFKSDVGIGTQVILSIPIGDESKIKSNNAPPKISNLRDVNVVVIDDDEDICQTMELLLTKWGCNVVTGENASVILKKCTSIPKIIIADYRLRENKTGGQAIKELQKNYNINIPAIIITGDTGADRLQEAKNEGYILLHKPVSVPKLRASINSVLRQP